MIEKITGKNKKYKIDYEEVIYKNKTLFKIIHALYIDDKKVCSLKNKLKLIRKEFGAIPVIKHHYVKQKFLKKWWNNNESISYGSFVREKIIEHATDKILYLEDLNVVIFNDKIIYFEDGLNDFLEKLIDQMALKINYMFKIKENISYFKKELNFLKSLECQEQKSIYQPPNSNATLENTIKDFEKNIISNNEELNDFYNDILGWAFVVVFYDIVFKPDFKSKSSQIFSDFIHLLCDNNTASKTNFSGLASLFSSLGLNMFNIYHVNPNSEIQALKDCPYSIELIEAKNFPLSNKRTEFLNIDGEKIILIPLSPAQIIIIAKESFINSKKMNLNVLEEYYINSAIDRYKNKSELEKESDDLIIFQDDSKIEDYKSILSAKEKIFYNFFASNSLDENFKNLDDVKNLSKSKIKGDHKKLKLNINGKNYYIDYYKNGKIKVNNKVTNNLWIIKNLKYFLFKKE